MKRRHFNKLVRDNIPEILKGMGKVPCTQILENENYTRKLREKLQEEVSEFLEDDTVEELADILEVLYALADLKKASPEQLEAVRREKSERRGTFKKKILLKYVDGETE